MLSVSSFSTVHYTLTLIASFLSSMMNCTCTMTLPHRAPCQICHHYGVVFRPHTNASSITLLPLAQSSTSVRTSCVQSNQSMSQHTLSMICSKLCMPHSGYRFGDGTWPWVRQAAAEASRRWVFRLPMPRYSQAKQVRLVSDRVWEVDRSVLTCMWLAIKATVLAC